MSSVNEILQTALFQWHQSNGGRMVEFAGWSMPVQYSSIIDEHHATRKSVGLFDVSHMGRFFFVGQEIDRTLDRLTTRRVASLDEGRIRYSLMTNEDGGILDDVLVYHLPPAGAQSAQFMMVVNASNREKIRSWIEGHSDSADSIEIEDRTAETVMIACQGPAANGVAGEISEVDPEQLGYYYVARTKVCGHDAIVSRTGYTGEDGCEIICENEHAAEVWEELHHRSLALRGAACGLAARDTLRLEAAMPLYGHELTEDLNAAQTDLGFAMNSKDREFIGRSAILAAKKDGSLPRRVGIELSDRRAARQGCPIQVAGQPVGEITSGTFSPTLERSISMGYVSPQYAEAGTELDIDIRGRLHPGRIVPLPFYRRS